MPSQKYVFETNTMYRHIYNHKLLPPPLDPHINTLNTSFSQVFLLKNRFFVFFLLDFFLIFLSGCDGLFLDHETQIR